jgi:16S rRNA (adenine1518-N6/adenine1519-N6)-dimethyltransferase
MPTLAQIIKELLRVHNRFPRKRLGQHFLIDPKVLQRIICALHLGREDLVVEIGSGLGQLTAELAKAAGQVVAVEIDKELLKISQRVLASFSNIEFVPKDILKVDLADLAKGRRYKIAGNLPYYITAPIIEKILQAAPRPEVAVLMVQREVAERMAAAPGSKKYGSFSIFVQFYAEVEIDSYVSKSSFYPWPEVSSAIVILKPYKTPKYQVKDEKQFFEIMHAAFQQRRKQLRNSLAKYDLERAGIDLKRRPETLSLDEFVEIANKLTP